MEEKQYPNATPTENDTWARDKGTIYDNRGGDFAGLVADLPTAHGMAVLENAGHENEEVSHLADEASHAFELKSQHEAILGKLTVEQKENRDMMNVIKEKYPLAFTTTIDSKGREVMVLNAFSMSDVERPIGTNLLNTIDIITVDGVFSIILEGPFQRNDILPNIDLTKFDDVVGNDGLGWMQASGVYGKTKEIRIPFGSLASGGVAPALSNSRFSILRYDMQNDENVKYLSGRIKFGTEVSKIKEAYKESHPNNGIRSGKDIGGLL